MQLQKMEVIVDVGQQLVDRLIAHGIRRVFGVPGAQTLPLYHGAALRSSDIEHVLMRDERSACYAADAYARVTRTVGVCDATVGPGSAMLVPGLVEAYCSSIPVLAIVADIPRGWEHRRRLGSASQGFEQRAFLAPCAKWHGRVEVPERLDSMLDHCVRVATSNRPGPVILEVPFDVFSASASEEPQPTAGTARFPRARTAPAPEAVDAAVAALTSSRRPAVFIGGGVHIADAYSEALALVERLQAPFATTISGKGAVSEKHPLALGVSGWFGSEVANEVIGQADCIVVAGSKLGEGATLTWQLPSHTATIIHIDVDGEEIGRNFESSLALQGDAKVSLQLLLESIGERGIEHEWDLSAISARVEEAWATDTYAAQEGDEHIKPQDLMRVLSSRLRDGDIVVADASLSSGWAASKWRVGASGRRLLAPRGLAGLGWGLPAAVGASFALRDSDRPDHVYCLAGDGAWGYSLTEIETLARFGLAVTSIVLNNRALGWNKQLVAELYPDGWVSHDFIDVRYGDAAEALGAWAVRISNGDNLDEAFSEALGHTDRPTVIEVVSSEFETATLSPVAIGEAAEAAY